MNATQLAQMRSEHRNGDSIATLAHRYGLTEITD